MSTEKVLSQIADSKQIFRQQINPANSFIPKSSARVGRSEQLGRDISRLFDSTAMVAKDQHKLTKIATIRIATEDMVNFKNAINEINASKTPGTDRRELARYAGATFGGMTREFDDEDQQNAYNEAFIKPAKTMLSQQASAWELEQKSIDRHIRDIHESNTVAELSSDMTSIQLAGLKDAARADGRDPQQPEYRLADSMNDNFMVGVREHPERYIDNKGNFNKEAFISDFNNNYRLFTNYDGNKFLWNRDGDREGTSDKVTQEKITKTFNIMNQELKTKAKERTASERRAYLLWVKTKSSALPGMGDEGSGWSKDYYGDKTFNEEEKRIWGDVPVDWRTEANGIRDKSKLNNNEAKFRIVQGAGYRGEIPDELLNSKEVKEYYNSVFVNMSSALEDTNIDGDTKAQLYKNMQDGINTFKFKNQVVNIANGFKVGGGKDYTVLEKKFGPVLDDARTVKMLEMSMKPESFREFMISRYYYKQGTQIANTEEYNKITKTEFKPNDDDSVLDKISILKTLDPRMSGTAVADYRFLSSIIGEDEADKVYHGALSGYSKTNLRNTADDSYIAYGRGINMVESSKPKIKELISLILEDEIQKAATSPMYIKSAGEQFIKLGKAGGYTVFPEDIGAYKNQDDDNGRYIVKLKGQDSTVGQYVEVDLSKYYLLDEQQIEDKIKEIQGNDVRNKEIIKSQR